MFLRKAISPFCMVLTLVAASGTFSRALADDNRNRDFTVITRNMDEATDFGPIFTATTFNDFAVQVGLAYLEVQGSNIPERADGLAAEIAAKKPYLVGLQEVSTWRTGPLFGHATTVTYDGLQSLLDALNTRGQHYSVLKIETEFEGEAPSALGYEVGFSDCDVVLVRTDLNESELKVSNVQAQHFVTTLTFPSPLLGSVTIPRGWISVDGKYRGKNFRFITTHLESFHPLVRAAQASELVLGPASTDQPVILAGDLNTEAPGGDPSLDSAYQVILSGGFADAWTALHPLDPGLTWPLHGEDPFTSAASPTQRLDLVFSRSGEKGIEPRTIDLIGNTTLSLTASGLWPSDHAGLAAEFRLDP